jgi:tetracycline 7-halogenase / FADH2 O2-dependent halogenase
MNENFDVIIIGSGIGGSTLALALGKRGFRTLVVEKNSHPRFAIGESTVPATTMGWNYLADKYDIPEFRNFTHYLGMRKTGLTGYPKTNFWFGLHSEGKTLNPAHELMFETLPLPLGPDVHMLRSDTDSYMVSRFKNYGVEYLDHTEVSGFSYDPKFKLAEISLNNKNSRTVTARLVVDASGHRGFFARKFDLMFEDPPLKTNTRTIFGHFENVKKLDDCYGYSPVFRFSRDGGTAHHCFEGGWAWVIPFDNGITSVGFMLDQEKYPFDPEISAEKELESLLEKFPSINMQLGEMKPIRPLVKSGRAQFLTKTILGEGYILTPHASGFVEPLFSTGLTLTQLFIGRFIPIIEKCRQNGDYSTQNFKPMEEAFKIETAHVDNIVSGMIKSFRNYDVFKQYWRIWVNSSFIHFFTQVFGDLQDPKGPCLIFGAAFSKWREIVKSMNEVVFDEKLEDTETCEELNRLISEVPVAFDISNFDYQSEKACLVALTRYNPGFFKYAWEILMDSPEMKGKASLARFADFFAKNQIETGKLRTRYAFSKFTGGELSGEIDRIHKFVGSKGYGGYGDFFAPFADSWNGRYLREKMKN